MKTAAKIATCCYCGTRAALVLTGSERHELSCASCGAPLHNLKMLRADKTGARDPVAPKRTRASGRPKPVPMQTAYKKPKKSKKKRKSRLKDFFEDAFDVIEDIFD